MPHSNSLFEYSRLLTREVMVGELGLGAVHPIRIQSMTTTTTLDTRATVAQSIRMIEAGCELVRITTPTLNDAKNLENIKRELRASGYRTPLVADIHFTPNAAEHAARIVEKVRVNPGNYADKKKFENIEYTDQAYQDELDRIRERFLPLVKICRQYGTAMRIGTNHGSLSDRILSRYGDTPLGMVESALEFLRICEDEKYFNIVLSMKASNPQVMVQAYRLLAEKMKAENRIYPLHLGVTEAGDGEDGRIKSAVGIGTLLEDGLGDTIRVSLTEEPEAEMPVAKALIERYYRRKADPAIPPCSAAGYDPLNYERRTSVPVMNVGGRHVPVVVTDFGSFTEVHADDLTMAGYGYDPVLDKWHSAEQAADFIFCKKQIEFELPGSLRVILPFAEWKKANRPAKYIPLFTAVELLSAEQISPIMNPVVLPCYDHEFAALPADIFNKLAAVPRVVFVLRSSNPHAMPAIRRLMFDLEEKAIRVPVIFHSHSPYPDEAHSLLHFSVECGALLLDGWGDGIWHSGSLLSGTATEAMHRCAFGILQATRLRISKTEYISCPSCGRTLFDLQETTAMIRSRTDHLKGIKIGIMGCIVNGPGEMADADYGYVGTGPGRITLYKGKTVVRRNIDAGNAVDELIALIKENGDWKEREER
ncbi:MAG: (E)-4-hydroxy-3-methylbut-2-enyl-diphosphate synthase [Bacteroidia bacterium]|nr:(E)-4-hydroxy-3-methylbut-2-enyl-diphosphate synthase [Bacteroidia bacterium]